MKSDSGSWRKGADIFVRKVPSPPLSTPSEQVWSGTPCLRTWCETDGRTSPGHQRTLLLLWFQLADISPLRLRGETTRQTTSMPNQTVFHRPASASTRWIGSPLATKKERADQAFHVELQCLTTCGTRESNSACAHVVSAAAQLAAAQPAAAQLAVTCCCNGSSHFPYASQKHRQTGKVLRTTFYHLRVDPCPSDNVGLHTKGAVTRRI